MRIIECWAGYSNNQAERGRFEQIERRFRYVNNRVEGKNSNNRTEDENIRILE